MVTYLNILFSKLQSLDYIGPEIKIMFRNNSRIQTTYGGLLSILVVTLMIFSIYFFGVDLLNKQNPFTLTSQAYSNSSLITLEDYPVFVGFFDRFTIPFSLEGFGKSQSMHWDFRSSPAGLVTTYHFLILEKCNPDVHFAKYKDFILSQVNPIPYQLFYCINPFKARTSNGTLVNKTIAFENDYGSPGSQVIKFEFAFCDPSKDSICDKAKQDKYKQEFYVEIGFLSNLVDFANNTNPFSPVVINQLQQLSYGLSKRIFLRISSFFINTDNGIIFEDISTQRSYIFSSLLLDINQSSNYFLDVMLESPNIIINNSRSYLKVQAVIANVGGVFKIFVLVSSLIVKYTSNGIMFTSFINGRLCTTVKENFNQSVNRSSILIRPLTKTEIPKPVINPHMGILDYIKGLACKKKYHYFNKLINFAKSAIEYDAISKTILDVVTIRRMLVAFNKENSAVFKAKVDIDEDNNEDKAVDVLKGSILNESKSMSKG